MNVLIVSHCNFQGNSALHALSIARELLKRGVTPALCVPDSPKTVLEHGVPDFQVLSFDEALGLGVAFPDGAGPSVIYAFTPREHVRIFTQAMAARHGVPYVVHLEDNEDIIVRDELPAGLAWDTFVGLPSPVQDVYVKKWRSHPRRARQFLAAARGVTVLMDRLLEFSPDHIPSAVFWPGFEERFLQGGDKVPDLRKQLGIRASEFVIPYTGNVHRSNLQEFKSLVLAVALLRRRGVPVRLVKTGWNQTDMSWLKDDRLDQHVTDLGFVNRGDVPGILALGDVLVQPGRPGPFDDYRFPSKLPEYLATGKPVILPRTNLGRFLADGSEAVILDRGDACEIAEAVLRLLQNEELRKTIGNNGRAFALRNLTWGRALDTILPLLERAVSSWRSGERTEPALAREAPPVKLIAFYLPQFHPVPENDEWWGKGFTEWTNVTRAHAAFEGHYQPQLPADLGFYDLRLPEVMEQQAKLARAYGIYGFCMYYYWFNGRRILERPLNQLLENASLEMPFCLCWANENWTRRWDGLENEVLLRQEYAEGWAERFIRDILPALRDPRYIRVMGAPLLLVYRVDLLPDPSGAVSVWRKIAREEGGIELHLAAVQSFGIGDPGPYGFDAAVEFPPHTERFLLDYSAVTGIHPEFRGYLEDYVAVKRCLLAKALPPFRWYRGVMPSWDNTARRGRRAHILVNASPHEYQGWLEEAVLQTSCRAAGQEPLVFINAWNEWGEGTHLEPDQRYGHQWLQATRNGLSRGLQRYYAACDMAVSAEGITDWVVENLRLDDDSPGAAQVVQRPSPTGNSMSITSSWFTDGDLARVAKRYRSYEVKDISYATVRDFVDSHEHLQPLATAQGDLKDVQRPWVLKAILAKVPRGGRLVEIGGGQPFVADLLARLGYEVWLVDPYDGSGNGPLEFERFTKESPGVRFVRDLFSDRLLQLPPGAIDCVYSISVLEHVEYEGLRSVVAGMKKFLKPNGWSVHAVDHVHRGRDAKEHFDKLGFMVENFGLSRDRLNQQLRVMSDDTETYYLSAESHNRWRGNLPYDDFPMRVCVSIQLCSSAAQVCNAHATR